MNKLHSAFQAIERLGVVEELIGLKIVANGPPQTFIGEVCDILTPQGLPVASAEVIGFSAGKVYLMPYELTPIGMNFQIRATGTSFSIPVGNELLGQIVNAHGHSLNKDIYPSFTQYKPTQNKPINPLIRQPISQRLHTGIHAIDGLLPLGKGQRLGVFAGSGVGKTTLLGDMVRHIESDINVIALIGERGREVNDFITHYLDERTLKKSILVVACSDETAVMRKQAAYTATTLAEYFCQQGQHVMLFMDSVTRFAMALREIGLSLGEPPTARGYTPSVFALLPGLIERTGLFKNQGSISALYTVLVEGDDFNEPLADHMRALLDGHIILSRQLAHQGHYPAIALTQSVSRLSKHLLNPEEQQVTQSIFSLISTYYQHQDLINLGAYKKGTNPKLDHAIERIDSINQLLTQEQKYSFPELMHRFKELVQ